VAEGGAGRYELVFVDPPYRMLHGPTPTPEVRELFRRLAHSPQIDPSVLIVVRHEGRRQQNPDLSPLVEWASREVGRMVLRLMVRPDCPVLSAEGEDRP